MEEGFSYIVTTQQLATILGVSSELVRLLSRQKTIPKHGRNEFDLREAVQAFYSRSTSSTEDESDYEKERARLTKCQADLAEHKFNVETGRYADADEVHRIYLDKVQRSKANLRRLARRLSVMPVPSSPREREVLFAKEIDDALVELVQKSDSDVGEGCI
jgi:phage terminase Nu1 subunit (DNA packaging protein)